ncbi:ribulose-phosphate 3-epimerase [Anaplasmataceae bacterium AB001_6]|nr:ribulose-phosphate 3-epimerase [Anaplasmataceae bacterium AB001_6]
MMKVSSSILSADFSNLKSEIDLSDEADMLHIDVMDGLFVPNITIGSCVIQSIRKATEKILDIHLMINRPSDLLDDFISSGADIITIHIESEIHVCRTLQKIRQSGKKSGIALVPSTNIESIYHTLPYVDLVLVMTVNPGFGGQDFMQCQMEKLTKLKTILKAKNLDIDISVDGGINEQTASAAKEHGADILVSGSYIYSDKKKQYNEKIRLLKSL